jgi:hypothetical protein
MEPVMDTLDDEAESESRSCPNKESRSSESVSELRLRRNEEEERRMSSLLLPLRFAPFCGLAVVKGEWAIKTVDSCKG